VIANMAWRGADASCAVPVFLRCLNDSDFKVAQAVADSLVFHVRMSLTVKTMAGDANADAGTSDDLAQKIFDAALDSGTPAALSAAGYLSFVQASSTEAPNFSLRTVLIDVWNLELLWRLELGAWCALSARHGIGISRFSWD
jgi:hypothetical protein